MTGVVDPTAKATGSMKLLRYPEEYKSVGSRSSKNALTPGLGGVATVVLHDCAGVAFAPQQPLLFRSWDLKLMSVALG